MNFTAFGRGSQQNIPGIKRRFDPVSPTSPNGGSAEINGHASINGNGNGHGNGNGNGHAANGHSHLNGNGNGHAPVNGNGNGNGHDHAHGNGRRIPSLRTTLSSGVSIKGTVKFRSELEIDGDVEGTIESLGRLTIGKNGRVRGDIQSQSVTIHGTVDGNLSVEGKCELRSGCTLRGDIETNRLVVDENVNFTGNAAIATRDYLAELRPSNGNGQHQS